VTDSADRVLRDDHRNWELVLSRIRAKVSSQQFETWFAPLAVEACRAGLLRLLVPNRFYAEWLLNHYPELLKGVTAEVTGALPELSIEVSPDAQAPQPEPTPAAAEQPASPDLFFNPRLTFEHFVVGPNNRLAHAASMAVAESPGGTYNPLFIHGGCGLGKTHLLQATCQQVVKRNPAARVLYVSCEGFISDFISALEKNALEAFRARYRDVDVLVVDDVHLLARKERSQEEFFHTFNALHSATRQVILSSDSPPSEIPTLAERLVSRFKWGLVTRIDPPAFETRLAIIQQKAHERGMALPDEVAAFVAERVSSSVRDLEGAIIRLVGYASLSGRPLDLELAGEVLAEPRMRQTGPTIDAIQEAVATAYKVKRSDLVGKRRPKSIAYPRQIAMYLSRKLTGKSLGEIGKSFGGRDHSTILYACSKIAQDIENEPSVRDMVERIERSVESGDKNGLTWEEPEESP